jgi:spore coat protein CotF
MTSEQIIEEAVAMWKEWKDISNGEAIDPEPYLRAALKHAMNTAVEERENEILEMIKKKIRVHELYRHEWNTRHMEMNKN